MHRVLAWVIGEGGLLGSQLARGLVSYLPNVHRWRYPGGPFRWRDPVVLTEQMVDAMSTFAGAVRQGFDRWLVLWAAGHGVMASPQETFPPEINTWCRFLELLSAKLLTGPQPVRGTLFLASSAGGVFGKATDQVLTEESLCQPNSEYGRCKWTQEELLRAWASGHQDVDFLIGRITSIYGPGQKQGKPQGLISYLSRCLIHQRPAHIYVPLDTTRDYVFVEDCTRLILQCLNRIVQSNEKCRVMKLIASEETASVAQVVGVLGRLARRNPRIVCSPSPLRQHQASNLRFRSTVWPDLRISRPTPLPIGMHRVHQHHLAMFQRGVLPQIH